MKSQLSAMVGALLLVIGGCGGHEEHFGGVGLIVGVPLEGPRQPIMILDVLSNTPASKAGLARGLVIQKIDDVPTHDENLNDCIRRLRGAVGTKVKLEVIDETHGSTNTVELIREEIESH